MPTDNVKEIRSTLSEKILKAVDLPMEDLYVPRWDMHILVRAMPVAHPKFTSYMENRKAGKPQPMSDREVNARRAVAATIMSALDPDTEERIFTWAQADELREKHYNSLQLIAAKAFELAGGDGPNEMTALEALDFLTAYGLQSDWDTDDMRHIGELRALVEDNLSHLEEGETDPIEAAVRDPDVRPDGRSLVGTAEEADEDLSESPKDDPAA